MLPYIPLIISVSLSDSTSKSEDAAAEKDPNVVFLNKKKLK